MADKNQINAYGKCAVLAASLAQDNNEPIQGWEQAALQLFPNSDTARKKGCPKNTFLGLCGEGLVKGIKAGDYTKSKKNKSYALQAVSLLKQDPELVSEKLLLWQKIMKGEEKQHNSQMDVVISLWNENLLDL